MNCLKKVDISFVRSLFKESATTALLLLCFLGSSYTAYGQEQTAAEGEELVVEEVVEKGPSIRIGRFKTSTFFGADAIGQVTNMDIWSDPSTPKKVGFQLTYEKKKMWYSLGFYKSTLSLDDIPRRFALPPALPPGPTGAQSDRSQDITIVNINAGIDRMLPFHPMEKMDLSAGGVVYGSHYSYENNTKILFSVGLGGQAVYHMGPLYLGLEYRKLLMDPMNFNDYFRWEIGLCINL